jgi:hypothetical protein
MLCNNQSGVILDLQYIATKIEYPFLLDDIESELQRWLGLFEQIYPDG